MKALVTDSAKQQISEMLERPDTVDDAASLLSQLQALTTGPGPGLDDPTIISLALGRGERVYVVRSGRMRALVTVDPHVPDNLLIASVYRATENETVDMREALSRSADILRAQ